MNKYVKSFLIALLTTISFCSTYLITTSIFAGKFDTYSFLGKTKDAITVAQIVGYFIGRFVGMLVFGYMKEPYRLPVNILLLCLTSILYIPFAFSLPIGQIIIMFISGIPMSLFWGFTMFYIEGQYASEIILMVLYMGLIASGGISKTIAVYIMKLGISENKMPLVCASIGLMIAVITTIILDIVSKIKINNATTEEEQTVSPVAMEQKDFVKAYWLPLILIGIIYGVLIGYRNYRDYFAYELWNDLLGENFAPEWYSLTETITSIITIIAYMSLFFIKSSLVSLYIIYIMMFFGGVYIGITTLIYYFSRHNSVIWICNVGIGVNIAYIPSGVLLYDKLTKATHRKMSSVFLIYVAEAYGPIMTTIYILIKSLMFKETKFGVYFQNISYITSCIVAIGMAVTIIVFTIFYKMDMRAKNITEEAQKIEEMDTFTIELIED